MCIEGCSARRFIVQCEQRVVVVEGAPLAADATACVPPLPVGGWLPESEHLRMPTGEHIKMWTSINENISQCEHLNKSTWQHLENISTCPWVCLVLLEKILVDRCSFALTWKSQLKNAENIWEPLWWMSFFLWVNITPWWTCEDGFTMTYPDTGSVTTGGGPFCEHFDQVKLYTIMFISTFDISTGTSGDAGYWWQMWNHMERRVDLCLSVTDCHTMRQCHSSNWRNSGKAVEHLYKNEQAFTLLAVQICWGPWPVVDRLEEPLRNDTLFPFYDIYVVHVCSSSQPLATAIGQLRKYVHHSIGGVNSYYAAPGIQALNGDNFCPCSSSYDHQPS